MRLALGSLAIVGGFFGVAHGCSSPSSGLASESQTDADTNAEAAVDANGADAPHCAIPPRPSGVPAGWELYADYDPCCLLYMPTTAAELPPPPQWTTCNAVWGPATGSCRQINQSNAGAPEFGLSVRDGVVSMLTDETINGFDVHVITDADGPVHQAILETDHSSACGPVAQDMRDGKYVYAIYPPDSFNGGGFIAGDVNEFKPSFIHHFNDSITHGVAVGQLGVLDVDQTDALNLYPWTQIPKTLVNPQDVGLQNSFPFFASNAVFWAATNATYLRVDDFTDAGGPSDLLSFGADWSRGAGDLGSDGKDMVWVEANGRTNPSADFDAGSYMTASFTTIGDQIVKRRLRSENPKGLSALPTTVGCGYAARSTNDAGGHINGIRIVRIADGVSWQLVSDTATPWIWVHALALTCSELFASVSTGPNTRTIARVQISSLGAGIAAD